MAAHFFHFIFFAYYTGYVAAHSGDPLICGGAFDPRQDVTVTGSSEWATNHGVQESCLNNIAADGNTGSINSLKYVSSMISVCIDKKVLYMIPLVIEISVCIGRKDKPI